jgi:hypothetical protein
VAERFMPRIQEVLIPALREEFPDAKVGSWVEDIDHREYPIINVRRLGGLAVDPHLLDRAVIELTVFGDEDLPSTEDLLYRVREYIYTMHRKQIKTSAGTISSYRETLGPTQFDSPFEDTWRVQMLIQLGVRPSRNFGESS